jgi:hypothetical protein
MHGPWGKPVQVQLNLGAGSGHPRLYAADGLDADEIHSDGYPGNCRAPSTPTRNRSVRRR